MTTEVSINAKVERLAQVRAQLAKLQPEEKALEADILDYMNSIGASRLETIKFDVVERAGKVSYDPDQVRARLGERISPELLSELIPDRSNCRMCAGSGYEPSKVNGTVARKVRGLGEDIASLVDQCAHRGPSTLQLIGRA